MTKERGGLWPFAALCVLYISVRTVVFAWGMRFDADNLTSWMQIADLALLRDHLWRTLWYLHSQPPLFNLIIGLALRLGPTGFPWAMEMLFGIVTLGGILATYALLREGTGRPTLAWALAGWLCLSPAVLLFSQKLYYDGLVPWLLVMALWGLHAGTARRSLAWMIFGFSMLATVVLLRSMIHPILFLAITATYLLFARGQRARVLLACLVPGACIASMMVKNIVLFGTAGLCSWAPLNFDATTVDRLPMAQRVALIGEGRLSRFATVPGFSPPTVYLPMLPPFPPTGEPSLDNLSKSTGEPNWNHRLYLAIAHARLQDARVGLEASPASFLRVLATSFYHFHRPSSEFKGLERNRAIIAGWERTANAVAALQPAAWIAGTDAANRPQAPILQISLTALLETGGFLGFAGLLMIDIIKRFRSGEWPTCRHATGCSILLLGGFVLIVSTACDVYENNRAHYDIGAVLMLGAWMFAARLWQIAEGRRRTGGAGKPRLASANAVYFRPAP